MIEIHGRAYPARTSRRVPATLKIEHGKAALIAGSGETLAEIATSDLGFEAPLGRTDRRAMLPDGTLFETNDHDGVARLTGQTPGGALHAAERFGPRLALVAVAAIAGGFAVWRFALPALVWLAVSLTPEPLKTAIDAGTLQAIDKVLADPTRLPDRRQSEIRAIFADLTGQIECCDPDQFELQFRDVPGIGPNAFALPGGTIVLTDALVREFPDDDVVAAVMGHELGHVVGDHGLTQLYRSLGFFVLVSLIAGDTGPILEDVLLEGGVILSLRNSRKHETEADLFGLRLTDKEGYEPEALITFFESLPDRDRTESGWASTHPASGERIETIREFLADR